MIKLIFDKGVGGYRGIDKPIYDSQDMVEKFISINQWRVKIVSNGESGVNEAWDGDFDFQEVRDIYGSVVYISAMIMGILKSNFPILRDEGDFYWMEWVDDDYLDWSCPQLVELMSYWQW
jgi:hypothetical protein